MKAKTLLFIIGAVMIAYGANAADTEKTVASTTYVQNYSNTLPIGEPDNVPEGRVAVWVEQ